MGKQDEFKPALQKLLAVAKEWREYCICANAEDNDRMDTAIELAEEALK